MILLAGPAAQQDAEPPLMLAMVEQGETARGIEDAPVGFDFGAYTCAQPTGDG